VRILLGVHQFPPFGSGGTEQLARWSALGLSTHGHASCNRVGGAQASRRRRLAIGDHA
jgi:hypothetical protein